MRWSELAYFFFFKQKTAYEVLRSLVGSEMCIRDSFFVGVSGRAKGGIGLGLSITREIVHAHGGAVEALPAGQGGCFVITMPLNREDD